jgi:hypothetical protein
MGYKFELHDLREDILRKTAEGARCCESQYELREVKFEIQKQIRRKVTDTKKSPSEVAQEFGTSFENGIDIVTGESKMEIEDMPPLLEDHDGAIKPSEIDGESIEVIHTRTGSESTEYPVVNHSSGYRICTCPSQKYHLVCKHTLARIIERNWKGTPNNSPV